MAKDFLPKVITWFRLDEHVRRLKTSNEELEIRVETLENAPAPSGGIESISGDFVDNTDPLNPVLDRGYKVYTAIIRQVNTDAPTLQVLENTLNLTLTPSYTSPGQYALSPNVPLPLDKTTVDIGTPHPDSNTSTTKFQYTVIQSTDSLIQLNTFQAGTSTWSQTDNCIRNNRFEIRLYN